MISSKKLGVTDDPESQHRRYQATLTKKAKDWYTRAFNERTVENNARAINQRLDEGEILAMVLNDVAKKIFPNWRSAVRQQKNYMRTGLRIGNAMPKNFFERLTEMNNGIPYYPHPDDQGPYEKLSEDELVDIGDNAKKVKWHLEMLKQGRRPDSFETVESMQEYLTQLYNFDQLEKRVIEGSKNKGKNSSSQGAKRKRGDSGKSKSAECDYCHRHGHTRKECRYAPENAHKRSRHKDRDYKKSDENGEKLYTRREVSRMMAKAYKTGKIDESNKNKRKARTDEVDNFMVSGIKDLQVDQKNGDDYPADDRSWDAAMAIVRDNNDSTSDSDDSNE